MPRNTPAIVLVHGALTDASVWHGAISQLQKQGFAVHAPSISMRGYSSDVAHLHSYLTTLDGPLIVVGHSYGGSIISDPDALTPSVKAIGFVAAFIQDTNETSGELNYRFAGSRLVPETTTIRETPAGSDMYLRPEFFGEVYAADVDPTQVAVMAASQHPIDPSALGERFSGQATWRTLPSSAMVATADMSIPTEAQFFMAERAGSAVVEIDSSHAVPVAHPVETARFVAALANSDK